MNLKEEKQVEEKILETLSDKDKKAFQSFLERDNEKDDFYASLDDLDELEEFSSYLNMKHGISLNNMHTKVVHHPDGGTIVMYFRVTGKKLIEDMWELVHDEDSIVFSTEY